MTETGIRVWNLKEKNDDGSENQGRTIPKNNSAELIRRLEDPENPLRFVIVVNRARSGINVHNFAAEVVCRLRDPKEIRTLIPIQMYGRLVRINVGTGSIIRDEFLNNIREYILGYHKKYGVKIGTIKRTIKIANTFDIWIPQNDRVKRTWQESVDDFSRDYVNSKEDGYRWLDTFMPDGVETMTLFELPEEVFDLSIQVPCNCKMIDVKLNDQINEWKGNGTLDAFFDMQ